MTSQNLERLAGERPAPATPPALNVTRSAAAIRSAGETAEALRRYQADGERLLAQWHADQQACREEGIVFDVELAPWLAAGYADWKQRKASRDGRELARADAEADRRAPPREA